jgi:hypothetical protein
MALYKCTLSVLNVLVQIANSPIDLVLLINHTWKVIIVYGLWLDFSRMRV